MAVRISLIWKVIFTIVSVDAAPRSPAVHLPGDHAEPVRNISRGMLALLGFLFLVSGASALIYEVVWTRQLTTFFGSTLYGVATVLSAFMGGLALGSYLIGPYADRMKKPLVVFGYFEIGIAVTALLFPTALELTQPILGAVYSTGGETAFYLYSLVRFALCFVLLMIPTTMMGATLPVLSKAVTNDLGIVGRRIGGLYAVNTGGAVLGVFLAGFVFLEAFGVFYTTVIAVAADFLVGAASIVLGMTYFQVAAPEEQEEAEEEQAPRREETYSRPVMRLVMATYALSGFIALAYQVAWTRALIFSFDSLKATTYSFSGMLVVFLLGLALGGALMQGIVDRQRNLLRLYAILQAGIGIFGGFSFFMLVRDWGLMQEVAEDGSLIYWNAVGNVMLITAFTIAVPTLLMGMAFPVVSKIVVASIRNVSLDVSKVYALNTLGAIFGSFCAGFLLIPLLGITGTLAVLAALNMTLAAALFWANPFHDGAKQILAAACILAAIIIPARLLTAGATFHRVQINEQMIHYEEGALATVSVIENNSGDRMIYVDGVGVAGTDKIMLTDQKSLAHVPMMLLGGEAKNVLSVGFGSGGASFSYTLYDDLEKIHTIEIAPEVLRAAPTLTDSNHGVIVEEEVVKRAQEVGAQRLRGFRHPLNAYTHTPVPGFRTFDPRWKVLVDDARSYLRFTDTKYDVIATDCTDLRYKSNANLYDLEYFELCREAITDRGLVVVWMPLAGLNEKAFRSALRTFQEVFPEMGVWYFTNQPTHYCLLIGGKGPVKIDYQAVTKAVTLPKVSEDLEEIGLSDPDKLISSFVCDERTLTNHLEGFPLNTEDYPIIEFESPRFGYDARPLYYNQRDLYDIQVPAGDLLVNVPEGEDPSGRIWKLQQANEIVFEGHHAYRSFDWPEAARLYMEAAAMVPSDTSIQRLLDFEEMRTHFDTARQSPVLRTSLNTLWIGHSLADVYTMQERWSEAATVAEQALAVLPATNEVVQRPEYKEAAWALHAVLVEVYASAGRERQVQRYLQASEQFASSSDAVSSLREKAEKILAGDSPA